MAITGSFDPVTGVLSTIGDDNDNAINTSRDAAGNIFVNGGAVSISGGTATVANTSLISVSGQGGSDTITLDESNGALPAAFLEGGDGNDTITGGSGADQLFGGNDNDVVFGGRGNDTASLGAGDDVFVWNPGDGSDTVEGEDGVDTLLFDGLLFTPVNVNENIDISANGDRVLFSRDVANVTMDLHGVEGIIFGVSGGADNITIDDVSGTDLALSGVSIDLGGSDGSVDTVTVNGKADSDTINISYVNGAILTAGSPATVAIFNAEAAKDRLIVNGGDGDDTINASALTAGAIGLTIDGGDGDNVITGSQGADTLLSGNDNDVVTGGAGNDTASLGGGDDVFVWNPGDGSDTVKGQAGLDELVFNGESASENIDISANGGRVHFFRDVDNVTMNLNGVENIAFHALGGADNIVINDVTGTDLVRSGVSVDLEGTLRSGVGDGELDTVTVNGTAGNDTIRVSNINADILVIGPPATVNILHSEATDQLIINGLGSNDEIDASGLQAGQISLTINGGGGQDQLFGSQGSDLVFGGRGNDTASLGAGDDVFVWNPGDGSDTVEGGNGVDTLLFDALVFTGANVNENIDISALDGHVRFVRDVANVTMDLHGVEEIIFGAFGGADNITINDVSDTDLALGGITIDLAGSDGSVDTVTIDGRAGDDAINISSVNGSMLVTGSPAAVTIFNSEPANDRLIVNGGDGEDTIDASALTAGAIGLTIDGGDGLDTLIGDAGNDVLIGGAGNVDSLFGGDGQDTFVFSGVGLATIDTGIGANNRDVIEDFSADIIDLQQIDAKVNAAGDQAFSFIGTNAFTAAGQVRFFADGAGNTIVEGNVDTDLHADFQIELHAFTAQLLAGDFLL